jgi:hypothetical protein
MLVNMLASLNIADNEPSLAQLQRNPTQDGARRHIYARDLLVAGVAQV